jgi:RNA polymerase sigma-70 factor (ECF subfamily)
MAGAVQGENHYPNQFSNPDRDISNDIFQDTFIKVIKTLKSNSYNEEGKFYWVMRISHNLIIDHFRKTKKMPLFRETEEFSIFP